MSCKYGPDKKNKYFMDKNGIVHFFLNDREYEFSPDIESYCIEKVEGMGAMDGYNFFFCGVDYSAKFAVSRILLIFSTIFLVATIIGYIFLEETRNVYGKTLMCYCSSLLFGYICLLIVQFHPYFDNVSCKLLGKL